MGLFDMVATKVILGFAIFLAIMAGLIFLSKLGKARRENKQYKTPKGEFSNVEEIVE